MKVFFDGKIFSSQSHGGISRTIFELIRSFNRIKKLEKIFYRGFYIDQYPFKKEWFKRYYGVRKPDNFSGFRFINLLDNIGMEMAYNLNVSHDLIYHSSFYRVPKNPRGPVVVNVYDMIHELFGDNPKVKKFKKKSFNMADLIISNSESTKKDLCKLYPIDPRKVVIAYPGVSSAFFNSTAEGNNKRPYMLYVGAHSYNYKNFDFLLDIFINRKYFLDFDLILVGGEENLTIQQKKKINETIGKGIWLKHKFCNDDELATLYSDALVFIYPSLYEGFGVPLIEAMACGCPVIASNISSMPEVAGDAALFFNPKNPDELAQKIDIILDNKVVANNLIVKGKIRAQKFTWETMADIIYREYLKLV